MRLSVSGRFLITKQYFFCFICANSQSTSPFYFGNTGIGPCSNFLNVAFDLSMD